MNQHFGEIISLIVAVSWTLTALSFEYASKKVGSLSLNIIRLGPPGCGSPSPASSDTSSETSAYSTPMWSSAPGSASCS